MCTASGEHRAAAAAGQRKTVTVRLLEATSTPNGSPRKA